MKYGFGHESVFGLVSKFWLDREGNFPTLFSGLLLLFISVLALANGETLRRRQAAWSMHWRSIAVVFLVMALDETVGIHERITDEFRRVVELDGVFRFQWVVVGIVFCMLAAALSARFVLALPRRIRTQVVASSAVYFTGAVGLEMVGGKLFEIYGGLDNVPYVVCATLEETLEIVGLLLFIRAFMGHLVRELDVKSFTVSFSKE